MARMRAPEDDYICQTCQCACDRWGIKHLGGGSKNFTCCGKTPLPILRSEWEAMIKSDVAGLKDRPLYREPKED